MKNLKISTKVHKCKHNVPIDKPCSLCDKRWGNKAVIEQEARTLRKMHLILELQEENKNLKRENKILKEWDLSKMNLKTVNNPKSKPRGRVSRDVKEWLEVNNDCPWQMCVCKCGKWYHRMDHLAPYHTEKNYCKDCGFERV